MKRLVRGLRRTTKLNSLYKPSSSGVVKKLLVGATITAPVYLYYTKSDVSNPLKPEPQANKPKEGEGEVKLNKALNGNWREFKIIDIKDESHDTKRIRIELWKRQEEFGLPVAGAVLIRKPPSTWADENKPEMRPYTPVIVNDEEGWVEFLVKLYPGGILSQYLAGKKPGDTIEIKGPLPKIKIEHNMKKNFTMLAGGTGVTPMYQILNKVIEDENDNTQIHLIISQKTEKDMLLKSEFEAIAKKYPKKIHLNWLTSDKNGHISSEHLSKLMPCTDGRTCGDDGLIFVCGPPAFYKTYSGEKKSPADQGELTGILKDMNFTKDHVYKL